MSYKWCVVPGCKSTTVKTPEKLFVCVPKNGKIRKKWLQLAYRNPDDIVDNSSVFFCEDHFDMEKDMANYRQYKMGFSQRIIMVDGVLPSKFHCQDDLTETTCDDSSSQPTHAKRQKIQVIPNCEDIEPTATAPEVTNDAHEIMDLSLDSDEESTPPLAQDLFCICCLERKVSLISLVSCTHAEFLDHFTTPLMELKSRLLCICCHAFLKKIKIFRQQVTASFKRILWDKTSVNDGKNQKLCKMSLLRLPKIDIDGRTAQPIKMPKAKRKNNKRKYKPTVIKNKQQVEKKETLKSEDKRPIDVESAKSADEFRENSKNEDSVRRNMETAMNIIKQNEENSITNTIQAITDKSLLDIVNLITTEVLSQEKISLSTQQAEPGDLPMMEINLESTDNGNDGGKLDSQNTGIISTQTESNKFETSINQFHLKFNQLQSNYQLQSDNGQIYTEAIFFPEESQQLQTECNTIQTQLNNIQSQEQSENISNEIQPETNTNPNLNSLLTYYNLCGVNNYFNDTKVLNNNVNLETKITECAKEIKLKFPKDIPLQKYKIEPYFKRIVIGADDIQSQTNKIQPATGQIQQEINQNRMETNEISETNQVQLAMFQIQPQTSAIQPQLSLIQTSQRQNQPETNLFVADTNESQLETSQSQIEPSLFLSDTSQSQSDISFFLPDTNQNQTERSQFLADTNQTQTETSFFLPDPNQTQTDTNYFLPDTSRSETEINLFLQDINQNQTVATLFLPDTTQTETSLFLTDANQSQTETSFFLPDASDSQTATSLFLPSTNQRQLEASLFPQSTSHSQPETRPETSTSQSQLKTSLLPTDSQSQTENRLFLLDTNNSQPETRLLPSTNQSQPVTSLFLPPTSHSQTETSLTISDSKQSQADTRLLPSTSQSQSAKIILATTSQNQIETSPSLPSTSQGQPKTSLFLPSTSQSQPETSLFHPSTSQSQPGNSIFLPSTSRSQIVTSQIQPVTSQSVSETCTLKSKSGHTIEILTVKINKNELLEEREKMATHNKYRHSEYKCEKCIIGFHYHENLIDHMKRKHIHIEGKDSVVCEICSQVVPKTNITNHETMHYTRYECRACHKRFQLFYDVTEHINNH